MSTSAASDSAGVEQQQRWNIGRHEMDEDGSNRPAKEGIAADGGSDEETQKRRRMTATVEAWP